jgi:hypothetical protein
MYRNESNINESENNESISIEEMASAISMLTK